MADITRYVLLVTLNVNGFNFPIKRQVGKLDLKGRTVTL
jgi:hypothetical protein